MTLDHAGGSIADADAHMDVGQPQLQKSAVSQGHVIPARDGGRGVWVRPPASLLRWSPTGRPPRHPVRVVPHRHRMPDHLDGLKDPALWTLLDIRAAPGGGGVRTGMTYDKEYGTSAGYFDKPKRVQFMEGPNEPAVAMHLQLNPRYINFEFQPLDFTFRRADGKIIHKYPDVGIELFDNSVVFGEIKSDDAWFEAPGIRRPLDRIDVALATEGLPPLLRIRGLPFRERFVAEAHRAAMDAAQTGFDEADKVAVRTVVNAAHGRAKYGDVVGALGGPRAVATDKLYAMLNSRIVGFDLSELPTNDTEVTLPRPATPFALRQLLSRLSEKAA